MQIEHHLFPTMPRYNLMKVRPLVQQFCKDNGYDYLEMSYFDCLNEVLKKLQRVSKAYKKPTSKVN